MPSAIAPGSWSAAPTAHWRSSSSTIGRMKIDWPTGCPRQPVRCGWCCAPTFPTRRCSTVAIACRRSQISVDSPLGISLQYSRVSGDMRGKIMRIVRSLLLAAVLGLAGNAAAAADPTFGLVTGTANNVVSIAPLNGSDFDRNNPVSCPLADVQQALGRAPDAGDQVQLGNGVRTDTKDPRCALRMRTETVSFYQRIGVVGAAAVLVIFLASLAAGAPADPANGQPKRKWIGTPTKFLLGTDGRYSNSQCQLALWFGVAMTMYLSMMVLRVVRLDWA